MDVHPSLLQEGETDMKQGEVCFPFFWRRVWYGVAAMDMKMSTDESASVSYRPTKTDISYREERVRGGGLATCGLFGAMWLRGGVKV